VPTAHYPPPLHAALPIWSVPYPVQILGTELLMELIGTDDERGAVAAPRLQETTPDAGTVTRWAELLRGWVIDLARLGLVPGDLRSAEHTSAPQSRFDLVC